MTCRHFSPLAVPTAVVLMMLSCTHGPPEFTPDTAVPFPADQFKTVAVLPVIITNGPGSNSQVLKDRTVVRPGESLVYGDAYMRGVETPPRGVIEDAIVNLVASAHPETQFVSALEVHNRMRVSQRGDFDTFLVEAADRTGADGVLVLSFLYFEAPSSRRIGSEAVHFRADLTLYDGKASPVWTVWTDVAESSLRLDILVERTLHRLRPAIEFRHGAD